MLDLRDRTLAMSIHSSRVVTQLLLNCQYLIRGAAKRTWLARNTSIQRSRSRSPGYRTVAADQTAVVSDRMQDGPME